MAGSEIGRSQTGQPCRRPSGALARGRLFGRIARAATLFLAFVAFFGSRAVAAEAVNVRAANHPTYGRLVLDWPAPITVEHSLSGGRLSLRFARSMTAEFAEAGRRLTGYLAAIELRDDGRVLLLDLAPGAGLEQLVQYEPDLVVLDFVADTARDRAPTGEEPQVRVGRHDDFTRVVFDFADPVSFDVERTGQEVSLIFGRAARFDAVQLAAALRPFLDELALQPDDRTVSLRLRPKVMLEAFGLDDDKVVVDLRDEEPVAKVAQIAQPAGPGSGAGTLDEAASAPRHSAAPAAVPGNVRPAAAEPAAPGSPAAADLLTLPPPTPAPAGAEAAASADQADGPWFRSIKTPRGVQLSFAWPVPVSAAVFTRAGWLWIVFDRRAVPDAQPLPVLDPALEQILGPVQPVAALSDVGATIFRIELRRPLGAQAIRAGDSWQILLRPEPAPPREVPLATLADPARVLARGTGSAAVVHVRDPVVGDSLEIWPLLGSGQGLPHGRNLVEVDLLPSAQGVVVRPRADEVATVRVAEGLEIGSPGGLRLSLVNGARGVPHQPEPVESRSAAPPPRGAEPAPRPPSVLASGGDLTAATSLASAAAFRSRQPTSAASESDEDGKRPLVEPAIRESETPMGPVSPAGAGSVAAPEPAVEPAAFGGAAAGLPLGFARFALQDDSTLAEHRAALMQRIREAAPEAKAGARLDLARFFLAHAMAAEALAVLRNVEDSDGPQPERSLEPARLGIGGSAELLMGRLRAAAAALGAPDLDLDPEVALWRAAIAAGGNEWQRAARELDRSEDTLRSYPPALQVRLGLPAALIAIENDDHGLAFSILDRLEKIDLLEPDRAQLQFIRGLGYARLGQVDTAVRLWRELRHGADEETSVKAGFALTTLLLDEERIGPHEALAHLQPMRPLWRGHAWEAAMLDRLAEIQAGVADPGAAIRTWRELLRRHPRAARRLGAEADLSTTFAQAMAPQQLQAIGPVRALALYRDFPELMPEGKPGQNIRRRLAERLAELDLIEAAAGLLEEVLRAATAAEGRAADGAMLAELWLRQPRPAAALAALDRTEPSVPASAVGEEWRLLRAQALAAQDRLDDALATLGDRSDPAAQELRQDILWRQEDWQGLARSIEQVLARVEGGTLAPEEQTLVIRLALAHAQLDETSGLEEIRRRYGPAMRGQPGEPAFLMATSTAGDPATPDAVLAAASRQIQGIHKFLAAR